MTMKNGQSKTKITKTSKPAISKDNVTNFPPRQPKEEDVCSDIDSLLDRLRDDPDHNLVYREGVSILAALSEEDCDYYVGAVKEILGSRIRLNTLNSHIRQRRSTDSRANSEPASPGGVSPDEFADKSYNTKEDLQAKVLQQLGEQATLFRTSSGELYARVPVNGHHETLSISEHSSGFRCWLTNYYFHETGSAPSITAMTQTMALFIARADREGKTQKVYTRVAYVDNVLYLDLGTEDWKVVRISGDGWEVVKDHPVLFRRPNGIEPMPIPERGGSLNELRPFINVASDDDWKMLVAWLLGVFHPKGPYPILAISGEQGTAKTSATRFVRNLVDPNAAPVRRTPKDEGDLIIAAKNSRVIALDNLSGMPAWLADALCCMSTGSGGGKRALYTDDQEHLFNERRPVVFNGIEELNSRGDLAERCLAIELEVISEKNRKTEEEIDADWAKAHPRVLGALLDAVAVALARRSHVKLDRKPRMADLAVWVTAAESHLGWKKGSFLEVYDLNREHAVELEVEASPVARAIIAFMEQQNNDTWRGQTKQLLELLRPLAGDKPEFVKDWPADATRLSGKLRRVAKALRASGINVKMWASNGKRHVELSMGNSDAEALDSDATVTHSDAKKGGSDANFSASVTASEADFMPSEGVFEANSDASDAKIPQSSFSESVDIKEKEREEKEEDREKEKSGKTASLASLPLFNNNGYLVDGSKPQDTPCSLCGGRIWVMTKSHEGNGFVCRNCHSDIAA